MRQLPSGIVAVPTIGYVYRAGTPYIAELAVAQYTSKICYSSRIALHVLLYYTRRVVRAPQAHEMGSTALSSSTGTICETCRIQISEVGDIQEEILSGIAENSVSINVSLPSYITS